MSESLRFLACGLTIETKPFPGDGPVRLERFRRQLAHLSAMHGDYDDDRLRIAVDRRWAAAHIEVLAAEARQRAVGGKLRLLPNPYASSGVSALHDRAAFRLASDPNTTA